MNFWETWEQQRERSPRNRLKLKLASLLNCGESDADEVVSLIEEMIEDEKRDLRDQINETGQWSRDY